MSNERDHFDHLETRSADARAAGQAAELAAQVAHARAQAPYFAETLAGVDPAAVTDRAALAALPVVRKSDLMDRQAAARPFGGLTAPGAGAMARVFQSPGPIYEPHGQAADFFRTARALHAAGFRAGDLVHNTFSYHLTPGGFIMDAGARALGCTVIPAGIGNTEQQLDVIADLKPVAYSGTPSFLRILLDKADEAGRPVPFTKGLVSGEYYPPALRQAWAERGLSVIQCYATADIGLIAYESPAAEGMIVDEGVIVEIVRPGTGEPVPDGEVGEVVVTTLTNREYPLIRFATGDLSAVLAGESPCGRTNMRIKGWMGRADQTTKVKGMFVHPGQVNQVVKRHDTVARGRLVVENPDNKDTMTLVCEVAGGGSDALAAAVAETVQAVCKVRGQVAFVEPGSLPNDGLVIEDKRVYE
ncbi:MAG: AMP-binding protein [Rhodobacterales bacterium]|nr:AMP-binding protein [Rhodobacterales bacterium]